MKIALFQYECRRCGAIVESAICRAEDGEEIINQLMNGLRSDKILYSIPSYYNIHKCNDNEVGICDLIGFKIEEDK